MQIASERPKFNNKRKPMSCHILKNHSSQLVRNHTLPGRRGTITNSGSNAKTYVNTSSSQFHYNSTFSLHKENKTIHNINSSQPQRFYSSPTYPITASSNRQSSQKPPKSSRINKAPLKHQATSPKKSFPPCYIPHPSRQSLHTLEIPKTLGNSP